MDLKKICDIIVVSGSIKQPGLPPGQNTMTKKQLTTIDPVLLGVVAQTNERVYKEEADFEADCTCLEFSKVSSWNKRGAPRELEGTMLELKRNSVQKEKPIAGDPSLC